MPLTITYPASIAIPRFSHRSLSSFTAITGADHFRFVTFFPIVPSSDVFSPTTIRMGGGPRTYPGGVSKWQWKRMQEKKAKQLLKARLCRERQLYEMRKRAELKAAISELERPWEVVERAPVLFSASADEQVKVLADRFQRPGGFDMWSERDGPRIVRSPNERSSVQFLPIDSVRPYGLITEKAGPDGLVEGEEETTSDDCTARDAGGMGRAKHARRPSLESSSFEELGWIRGKNRVSYGSDLESALGASSEEGGGGDRHGQGRGQKTLGRANLRPTTELRGWRKEWLKEEARSGGNRVILVSGVAMAEGTRCWGGLTCVRRPS
ncbi:hypothetical protein HPP92_005607 [Vanilla planifolia]|uniref:DEAD-box ATP-dependent RNA helicase 33 n=1 Tax=Vanilla planifolia TaxID=51239 RepID=A0A835RN64_VANPL|nr:hypothetical protein HPP92_005607 [Vanilla planifolia]